MSNIIKFLCLVLCALAGACSANVESADPEPCPEAPAPVCAPVQKCADHIKGYSFTSLSSSQVGECTFYRYACAPDGTPVEATAACEQLWETFCPQPDYDPNYGERGE